MKENKSAIFGIFFNDIFMLVSMIIAAVASVAQAAMNYEIRSYFSAFTFILNTACVIVLYLSYKKHDKNVMKGMMGAILMLMLLRSADNFSRTALEIAEPGLLRIIAMAIPVIIMLAIMINHFIINADRHSKPWNVKVNQILFVILLVVQVLYRMYNVVVSDSMFLRMSYLVSIFTMSSTICLLICIETKMEGYKALREANGWVETPYSGNSEESAS